MKKLDSIKSKNNWLYFIKSIQAIVYFIISLILFIEPGFYVRGYLYGTWWDHLNTRQFLNQGFYKIDLNVLGTFFLILSLITVFQVVLIAKRNRSIIYELTNISNDIHVIKKTMNNY